MGLPGSTDKTVRATDLDALSCRSSANKKGYFDPPDPYISQLIEAYESALPFCEGYTQLSAGRVLRTSFDTPKLPLINRGTYFRTASIDRIVSSFVGEHKRAQVVSLGGGSDTRAFRVLPKHAHVTYTEIDFAESTRVKKLAISRSASLKEIVGAPNLAEIELNSRDDLAHMEPDLHCPRYNLVAYDLRKLAATGLEKLSFLDKNVPTLVISECVLCYLTPEENISVLQFWQSHFASTAVVLYDPMGLHDAFGEMMAQNLSRRGLNMLTFTKYPDLPARKRLFEDTLGFRAYLTDSALMGGYSTPSLSWFEGHEVTRVSRLEMIDEVEEIALLLSHYCLIYAEAGMSSQFAPQLPWSM